MIEKLLGRLGFYRGWFGYPLIRWSDGTLTGYRDRLGPYETHADALFGCRLHTRDDANDCQPQEEWYHVSRVDHERSTVRP